MNTRYIEGTAYYKGEAIIILVSYSKYALIISSHNPIETDEVLISQLDRIVWTNSVKCA